MDPLTTAAASGIRARIETLEMLANNIANASAPGFKADREYYGLYVASEAADSPPDTRPVVSPVVERQWTDFTQGSLTPTDNPLDLALNGKGFFVAASGSGPVFTRDGSLRLSPSGQLQTLGGYAIQGQDGKPILLDPSKAVEITPGGLVRQDGQDISQIAVVDFLNPSALVKLGNNYFQSDVATMAPVPAPDTQVHQGRVEAANSQPVESTVKLINVLRQFETLQKALAIGTDMNKRAIEEVARINQ
jgi:flagellar basal-body rod protein FlgF